MTRPTAELHLPGTLTELVRARIGSLDTDVQELFLAASCVASPTVELVAAATDTDVDQVFELLEQAESKGIVAIEGHRLRFEHPLLARGVYVGAATARRRAMHRRLAAIVEQPELHARHLALAARHGDHETLESLDTAAEIARIRGAPAAAAELLDLAVGLGGDSPERRIRLAGNHFSAGDSARARTMLEETIEEQDPGPHRAEALSLLGMVRVFDDNFLEGVRMFERAVDEAGDNLALRAPTLVILALTLFNTGRLAEGVRTAEDAVMNAERLGEPQLLSQALSMRVLLRFIGGDGVDAPSLQRALETEAREADVPARPGLQTIVRPSLQHAMLLGWTGQLELAHQEMRRIRQRCVDNGEEHELMYVAYYSVQIELWRGDFAEAAADRRGTYGTGVATGRRRHARRDPDDAGRSWPPTSAVKSRPVPTPTRRSPRTSGAAHSCWRRGRSPSWDSSSCRWVITELLSACWNHCYPSWTWRRPRLLSLRSCRMPPRR